MRTKWLLSLLFLSVFLISVVFHMPIAWLIQYLPQNSHLAIQGSSGTVWHGKAEHVLLQQYDLGELQWKFEPVELLSGGAAFSTRFGRGSSVEWDGKGLVGYNLDGLYAKDLLASIKADRLMKHLKLPLPVHVEGVLELTLNEYQFSAPWCEIAQGELVWFDAQLNTALGAVNLDQAIAALECHQNTLTLQSVQDSSALSSEFSVELHPDATYKISGWIKPGDELPSKVRAQLKWLGSSNTQGQYKLNYTGQL
ncbi:type II secretion system protein N [Aliivibrio kagoshimensis]|uniref:type II secretion system protein N n=1 Tax=Aliivibrio kagoshimensis TaxID=2910230 RepID=UPI003D09AEC2